MKTMLGHCGYDCSKCAARSDDPRIRQRLVDGWRKFFGHERYTVDNVRCDGCRADGRLADTECQVRPCARERGVEMCPDCGEFPCDKVRKLMASGPGMVLFCLPRTRGLTRAEYELCMRQFDSMGTLVRRLAENGELDPGIGEAIEG